MTAGTERHAAAPNNGIEGAGQQGSPKEGTV